MIAQTVHMCRLVCTFVENATKSGVLKIGHNTANLVWRITKSIMSVRVG